jgi:hypothetical protein
MTEYDSDRAMRARLRAQARGIEPLPQHAITAGPVPEVPEPTTRLYRQDPTRLLWPRLRRPRPAGRSTSLP